MEYSHHFPLYFNSLFPVSLPASLQAIYSYFLPIVDLIQAVVFAFAGERQRGRGCSAS